MSSDLARRGLLAALTLLLRDCSYSELRALDVVYQTLLVGRGTGDRQWQRRIATGPHEVDRSWHLTKATWRTFDLDEIGVVRTACRRCWSTGDRIETSPNPPLEERCHACWRAAVQGDALGLALIDAWGEIQAEERAKVAAHERARDEMVPRSSPGIARPPVTPEAWAADVRRRAQAAMERRTAKRQTVSIGHVPGDGGDPVEIPMARHLALVDEPDREVVDEFELEQHLTPGDAEEPIGVQVPEYDFEGGGAG